MDTATAGDNGNGRITLALVVQKIDALTITIEKLVTKVDAMKDCTTKHDTEITRIKDDIKDLNNKSDRWNLGNTIFAFVAGIVAFFKQ